MTDTSKPAFAKPASPARIEHNSYASDGMTLREYYAGQALAGFCSNPDVNMPPKSLAEMVVNQADALIAELNK